MVTDTDVAVDDSDVGSAEESEGEDVVSETIDDDPHGEFGMWLPCVMTPVLNVITGDVYNETSSEEEASSDEADEESDSDD